MSKSEIISKIYHDPAGYGSMKSTLGDARKVDKSVTLDHVKTWFSQNVEKKTQVSGMNSFVAPRPYYEYQLDLFFINDLGEQKMKIGMAMIDIFTKFGAVVAIPTKSEGDVASGLLECLNKMGHKPEIIYSDDETALSSFSIQQFFKEKKIDHVITRSHAWFVERFNRTFKDMLYKRMAGTAEGTQWTDFIYPIMLLYNHKMKHSATGHTPSQAKDKKNQLNVHLSMELIKKSSRKYPPLDVGDHVKIYRKRKAGEKQQVSLWSDNKYIVEAVTKSHGQDYYKLTGLTKQYLRFELLKI